MKKVYPLFFSFLLGGVVGASVVAAVSAVADDEPSPAPTDPVGAAMVAPVETDTELPGLRLNPKAGDLALARHLERAGFDNDWRRVVAVADVLRKRTRRPNTAAPVQAQLAKARQGGSLIAMDHAYRRRAFLLELAGRDNAATRAVASGEVEEQEKALVDLFQAPLVEPGARAVRRDAAYLLGTLKTKRGREVLLRALEDPDPKLARVALEALGRAEDRKVVEELGRLIDRDPDPKIRGRAVRSLTYTLGAKGLEGRVVGTLTSAAVSDRDLKVRTLAISALARANLTTDQRARTTLQQLAETETEDAKVRQAAVASIRAYRALARSLPAALVKSVEGVVERATGELLLEAVAALAEAGTAESVQTLEARRLASRDPVVQKAIAKAIRTIKRRDDDQP